MFKASANDQGLCALITLRRPGQTKLSVQILILRNNIFYSIAYLSVDDHLDDQYKVCSSYKIHHIDFVWQIVLLKFTEDYNYDHVITIAEDRAEDTSTGGNMCGKIVRVGYLYDFVTPNCVVSCTISNMVVHSCLICIWLWCVRCQLAFRIKAEFCEVRIRMS